MAGVWRIPAADLPGPGKSAYELLTSIGSTGGIRALVVMGSNIAVSAPDALEVERRLKELDFLVVADFPTLPERDNFYEAGFIHRFPFGLVSKFAGYYKVSTPGIDDNTVPGSAIVTSVNIAKAKITGIETVQEIRPPGPFGVSEPGAQSCVRKRSITGGFFPTGEPQGFFDLDHDQRLSGLASGTYAFRQFYMSLTGTYGSGLTNGVDPADCGCAYGTGLFDFNRGIKVKPSFIMGGSAGYSFAVGQAIVRRDTR